MFPSTKIPGRNGPFFAIGEESCLLMAAYPEGKRPEVPFPYYTETMTGFEYTAAVGMRYEGVEEQWLQCISDIRKRFDGAGRSPFNETECGYRYVRGMASWTAVLAWTGFLYRATDQSLRLGGEWPFLLVFRRPACDVI